MKIEVTGRHTRGGHRRRDRYEIIIDGRSFMLQRQSFIIMTHLAVGRTLQQNGTGDGWVSVDDVLDGFRHCAFVYVLRLRLSEMGLDREIIESGKNYFRPEGEYRFLPFVEVVRIDHKAVAEQILDHRLDVQIVKTMKRRYFGEKGWSKRAS